MCRVSVLPQSDAGRQAGRQAEHGPLLDTLLTSCMRDSMVMSCAVSYVDIFRPPACRCRMGLCVVVCVVVCVCVCVCANDHDSPV